MNQCNHILTQGRKDEKGSWCVFCGVKVFEVETRECAGCSHISKVFGGHICKKHLMAVSSDMLVTFKIKDGTCWEDDDDD